MSAIVTDWYNLAQKSRMHQSMACGAFPTDSELRLHCRIVPRSLHPRGFQGAAYALRYSSSLTTRYCHLFPPSSRLRVTFLVRPTDSSVAPVLIHGTHHSFRSGSEDREADGGGSLCATSLGPTSWLNLSPPVTFSLGPILPFSRAFSSTRLDPNSL